MNRINIRDFRRADNRRNIQITFRRRRAADADRFVGVTNVQGFAVGGRMHGDGFDAHFPARPDYPAGDFAAVGDQDFANFSHS